MFSSRLANLRILYIAVINAARYEHITSFVDSFDLFFFFVHLFIYSIRSRFFFFHCCLSRFDARSVIEVMRTCLLNQLNYIAKINQSQDNGTQARPRTTRERLLEQNVKY